MSPTPSSLSSSKSRAELDALVAEARSEALQFEAEIERWQACLPDAGPVSMTYLAEDFRESASLPESRVKELTAGALALCKAKEYESALTLLGRAALADPQPARWFMLARCMQKAGQLSEAAGLYWQVSVGCDHRNAAALCGLGECLERLQNPRDAAIAYQKSLKLKGAGQGACPPGVLARAEAGLRRLQPQQSPTIEKEA